MILNSPYISGSLTVTGNITACGGVTISGSIASASYASNTSFLNGSGSGEFVPTGSFNTFSSSILTYTGSANSRLGSLETASGSAITRLSALEVTSGSNITRIAALEIASGSAQTQLTSLQAQTGSYATTGSNTFVGGQYLSSSFNPTGFSTTASLYTDGGLRVTRDAYISGTLYLNNVTVYGTQSVCYITSSQLNIANNLISVNTSTPSVRFGGLAVYDSGSTGLTGSILWDSENNHWVYSNPSGSSYSGGMFISGPRTSTLGSETGTTACMLLAGQGGDHLTSSLIYHSSTVTCIPNTLINTGQVCGVMGNFSCIGVGTSSPSYKIQVESNQNSGGVVAIRNSSSGTAAYSGIFLGNDQIDNAGGIGVFSSGYTPSNSYPVNGTYLYSSRSGGIAIISECTTAALSIGTSNCSRMCISPGGVTTFTCQVCAPSFIGGTISGTSGTFSGNITVSVNQNSLTRLIVSNTTAGTGAYVETSYTSDSSAGAGAVGKFGSSTTPYKITTASNTYLYNSVAGDIAILNDFSSGTIKMAAGGSSTPHFIITSAGIACFSNTTCTSNLISTDATHTILRMSCAIVPLANYRTSDCGYGGIDFFDNGKGYACAAKFYTFKSVSSAEYYGFTNDYNGSAQLALVSCGGGAGNNISFFTGTSTTAKLRIDNNVSCFSQTVCAPTLVGNASSQQIMAIGAEADIWMCNTGGGAGTWRLLGSTGNSTKLFRIYDGDAGSNRFTIKSDGLVCIPFGVKFGNGSGQLNYYEEGSWTPALLGATVSYDFRSGSYIRIGNYVFVRWGFRISSISGQSGTVTISGLPFTAVNWGSYQEPNVSVSTGNLATADYAQRARLYKGGNDTSLYGRIADNGDTSWNTSQLQANSWVIGEIFYNV